MLHSELATLFQVIASFGIGAVLAGLVVAYLLKSYLPSYLSKKAENLATREDIAAITREVEAIKNEYLMPVEELRAHHQLKMAALTERLRVQQQAFTLWRSLNRAIHERIDSKLAEQIAECQKWWEENCLYLNAESREAFQEAYWAAQYFREGARKTIPPQQEIQQWQRITHAGEVIVRSVDLPSLGKNEQRDINAPAREDA